MQTKSVIMLVDDSRDDLELMRVAFKKAGVRSPIAEMQSGEEAVAYLSGENGYADRTNFPLPCVIITDLKMSGVDGFELLEWLKKRSGFDSVPKLVLTSSGQPEDQRRARESGCSAYFVKPSELDGLVKVVGAMNADWISERCQIGEPG